MSSRRTLLQLSGLATMLSACEALGIKANIVTTKTVNGETTTTVREAKNWDEFEAAMGEVATNFSDFAKEVGATTAALATKLVDVPPQGEVQIGQLSPSLKPYEGDVRYDYLKVAKMNPNADYDFKYVQIGMPEYDNFFKSSAEMYATAYQLTETGRHVFLATASAKGQEAPSDVEKGNRKIKKSEVDSALMGVEAQTAEAKEGLDRIKTLWLSMAELGAGLASKSAATIQAGAALVTSAPSQITNPKLVLHLDLIVKGLKQSLAMAKDTAGLLTSMVG